MPKATKSPVSMGEKLTKSVHKKGVKLKVIEVGSRVRVVTEYVVKRIMDNGSYGQMMVSVEDSHGDRVLNFRLGELQLVE